jgi:hypothetical protein
MVRKWSEGVNAIVSGQDVAVLGEACFIPYGEYVRVNVTAFFYFPARPPQKIYKIDVMDAGDMFLRKG